MKNTINFLNIATIILIILNMIFSINDSNFALSISWLVALIGWVQLFFYNLYNKK